MICGRRDEENVSLFQDLLFAGDDYLEYATFHIGTLGMNMLVNGTYTAFFEVHLYDHQAFIVGHDFAFTKVVQDFPFDIRVSDPIYFAHVQK
jgi:hypothetical protein